MYADTPSTTHLDHLGRAFLLEARNRWVDLETEETPPETRAVLDIEGNVLRVVDARGNVAQENRYWAWRGDAANAERGRRESLGLGGRGWDAAWDCLKFCV